MTTDNRTGALRVFRIVCTIAWIGALVATCALAFRAVTSFLPYLPEISSPSSDSVSAIYGLLLTSNILEIIQAVLCVGLFFLMSRGNPFRAASSVFLFLLGISILGKALFAHHLAAQTLSLFSFIGTGDIGNLILESTLDVSAIILGALLVLLSFLFRYAQELFLDSEEMA